MRYFIEVDLLKLNNAEVIDRETFDGGVTRGVFIPLDENGLRHYKAKNQLVYFMDGIEARPNPDGYTHNIKPYVRKAQRADIRARFGIPYIGRMKPQRSQYQRFQNSDIDAILGIDSTGFVDEKRLYYHKKTDEQIAEIYRDRRERLSKRMMQKKEDK